jgi:hypothetical protein
MMRLHHLADAVSYFEIARRAENSPEARKRLSHNIAVAKAELWAERQNAARQPLLHEALEQDGVVRPRLAVREALAMKVALDDANLRQGGVKQ